MQCNPVPLTEISEYDLRCFSLSLANDSIFFDTAVEVDAAIAETVRASLSVKNEAEAIEAALGVGGATCIE